MFSKLFKKTKKDTTPFPHDVNDIRPTAHTINYSGKGVYKKSFQSDDFGVVFEDDGKAGYFYATNSNHKEVFDSLLLYNYSDANYVPEGQIFIVINESLKKAGIFYHNQFQAIFDFKNKRGCSRLGFPILESTKWRQKHVWDDAMIKGLEPQ